MIYFFIFHTKPKEEHPDYIESPGAYINCWIESVNIDTAKISAERTIDQLNWTIIDLTEGYEIHLSDYDNNIVGKEFYEQALIDKEVYRIHTYKE